ncbi:MAG TPA: YdeI/OmpD-associated family protein [Tepidisphaeraceae bacterium]|nr:YdeI/OmpD-associated family protein [Tepidisphaeraceae bacterium]
MRKAKDVDEYIASASDITRAILVKLRRIFQQASPKLHEAIKWGVPCFVYKGPVGGFAAYKAHVSWGLWKSRGLSDPDGLLGNGIMAGGKITKVSEIPPAKKMANLIKQVIALNEAGMKPATPDPKLPADFAAAMKKSSKAAKQYAVFTPARKWQYVNWIAKAKRPETRAKRIQTAVGRIGEGKTMK